MVDLVFNSDKIKSQNTIEKPEFSTIMLDRTERGCCGGQHWGLDIEDCWQCETFVVGALLECNKTTEQDFLRIQVCLRSAWVQPFWFHIKMFSMFFEVLKIMKHLKTSNNNIDSWNGIRLMNWEISEGQSWTKLWFFSELRTKFRISILQPLFFIFTIMSVLTHTDTIWTWEDLLIAWWQPTKLIALDWISSLLLVRTSSCIESHQFFFPYAVHMTFDSPSLRFLKITATWASNFEPQNGNC